MSLPVARKIMANMPEEVFDMYLAPLIANNGWPFRSRLDSTAGSVWVNLFDHQTLQVIAQLRWERREIPLDRMRFHPRSKNIIDGLIGCHLFGQSNKLSAIPRGRERFLYFMQFSVQGGRVPAPVALMLKNDTYRILDGNHRIAGLIAGHGIYPAILDCWVGHHTP